MVLSTLDFLRQGTLLHIVSLHSGEQMSTGNIMLRYPCNGLTSPPGRTVVTPTPVTLCWVSCDGLASPPGGTVVTPTPVTLCWLSCDGLASPPGGTR